MSKLSPTQEAMLETFQQHMAAELTGDLRTAMVTMTDNPSVIDWRTGDDRRLRRRGGAPIL